MKGRKRRIIWSCSLLIFMIGIVTGCQSFGMKETTKSYNGTEDVKRSNDANESTEELTPTTSQQNIYVYVCGAVKQSGVYELKADARVFQALEKAGGTTKKADLTALNQAEKLTDGQKLEVPEKSKKSQANQQKSAQVNSDKLNLNKASKEQLMTLAGIGEAKANAIIQYRESQGGFKSIDDIMKIEGIKEGVYNKIKEKIIVE